MLARRIDVARDISTDLGRMCPGGFKLLVGIRAGAIGRRVNGLQDPWRRTYFANSYRFCDPIIAWGLRETGFRLWTDLDRPDPDPVGFLADARRHGIGALAGISTATEGLRSVLEIVAGTPDAFDDDTLEDLKERLDGIHEAFVRTAPRLTDGEAEALRLVATGAHIGQAAYQLGISESAVKLRLASARKRLGAATTIAAIHTASAEGLMR